MIRTFALLLDNIVLAVEQLDIDDDALMQSVGQHYSNIVDIEDMIPRPDVSWILVGNQLVPDSSIEPFLLQQKTAREFGLRFSGEIADLIGARNLKLAAGGTTVNIATILQQLNTLKALLDTGCLRAAVNMATAVSPSFPAYSDIFNYAVMGVNAFLAEKGY